MAEVRCKDCKYYVECGEEKFGDCVRFPKKQFVYMDSWCGEFVPKKPQAVMETTTIVSLPAETIQTHTSSDTDQWIQATTRQAGGRKRKKKGKKKQL